MRDSEGEKVRKRVKKIEKNIKKKVEGKKIRNTEIRHSQTPTERKTDTEIDRERYKH